MHNYQKPGVVYGKRFFDVLFSFLGILLASPIILILIILGLISNSQRNTLYFLH